MNSTFSTFPAVPFKASVTLLPKLPPVPWNTPPASKYPQLTLENVKSPCVGTVLATLNSVALVCVAVIVDVSNTPATAPCALVTTGVPGNKLIFV